MSIVKFGTTDRDANGGDTGRKFGKKADRVNYWKFGEPLNFYILDAIKNYLPRFIIQNALCNTILRAIAIQLVRVEAEAQKLPDFVFLPKPALKYANSDLQLHISFDAKPDEVKQAIKDTFIIHRERGTLPGIVKDLRRLTGDPKAYIIYYGYEECGWWTDYTYPEYNGVGKVAINSNGYFDLYNMLDLVFCNHSGRSDDEVIELLRNEIVPINVDVRFLVSKIRTIKFGEPYNFTDPATLQFGVFVFNQQVGGCGTDGQINSGLGTSLIDGYGDDYGDDYGAGL